MPWGGGVPADRFLGTDRPVFLRGPLPPTGTAGALLNHTGVDPIGGTTGRFSADFMVVDPIGYSNEGVSADFIVVVPIGGGTGRFSADFMVVNSTGGAN